jgi:glycine amidinotransferase/scyllo-inosamine-4-phosphate amidinotransferase 1
LADILEREGVVVHRPKVMNFQELGGMYNYCPRDRLLVYGDEVVDTAMMYPCRDMEINALDEVIQRAGIVHAMPRDSGMILDAANIARLGDKWLYLESPSGNLEAYGWLQKQFPDVEIELCNFYAGVHIDSTIVPLREGLALINGARVSEDQLPNALKDWECIFINDVVPQGFHEYPYASKWIALNMLMINPNLAVVDKHQDALIEILESHGIRVIRHELRHSRTLGGGFHCVTLDLVRD